jgi:3D (Asp-Asp-Asp) domain-containing protein
MYWKYRFSASNDMIGRLLMTARVILLISLLATTAFGAPLQRVGRAMVTFYWLIDETAPRYRGKAVAELEDARGRVIAMTSVRFRKELIREGSGHLRDGRTVAYDQRLHGTNRFRIVHSEYGVGRLGCALVPYRTIAVDPHFVKLGSLISIPQLKGTRLPDGTIHDGLFVANDRGHFRGPHVDLFVGLGPKGARPFIRKGYGSRSHVTVYFAGEATTAGCRP